MAAMFSSVSRTAVLWAVAAGLCIGAAEIGYFYLFRGIGGGEPMEANVAIPVIVSGAIVLTVILSWLVLREPFTWARLLGAALVAGGVVVLFADFRQNCFRTVTAPIVNFPTQRPWGRPPPG